MIAVFIKLHPRNATTSAADRDMPEIQDIPGYPWWKVTPQFLPPLEAQCSLLNWRNLSDLSAARCLLQERIYLTVTILVWWCQCQCGGTVRNGRLRETRTDICPKLHCLYSTDYALLHSQLASTSLNVWLAVGFYHIALRPTLSWNCTMDTNLLRWILLWSTRLRKTVAVFGSPKREQWQKTSKIWKD